MNIFLFTVGFTPQYHRANDLFMLILTLFMLILTLGFHLHLNCEICESVPDWFMLYNSLYCLLQSTGVRPNFSMENGKIHPLCRALRSF